MSKYVCPRCFTEQDTNDVEYICTNISRSNPCPRQKSHTPFKPDNLKSPICDKCGQPVMTRVCPKCGFELPNNIENTNTYPIAIIGAKECGKSNYVAVLINELKNEIGRAFNCSLMACGDKTINRYRNDFYNPLYRHKTCVRGSDAGDVDPLIYSLTFLKKNGFLKKIFGSKTASQSISLTFYDTAGENLDSESSMLTFNRYLAHASGIILLLDPLQLPNVRNELHNKVHLPEENTDVTEVLNRTIEVVRQEQHLPDTKKIDIPVAIAFTKIDAVQDLLDPSSCLHNDSEHISDGYFSKNDFSDENDEMQSLVDAWMGQELYQLVSVNFNNFGFFGLSALGSNPDTNNVIPKFRPFRVADPFLWLLAERKIIPTK